MAGGELPTAKERREMLAQDSPNLSEAGRALARAGRYGEALECLEAAGDQNGLAKVASAAAENGDLFLYRRAKQLLGDDLEPRDLASLAEAAEMAGKLSHATAARKILHQEES
jgi:hypothetical protein